jgi:hypothetical protein
MLVAANSLDDMVKLLLSLGANGMLVDKVSPLSTFIISIMTLLLGLIAIE